MPKPNIIYIHSHDTGRYVSPYGHAMPTPNIQSLAEEGVLFRQAFCAAPTCSPSRAGLVFGQWPHSAGMLGLVNRGFWPQDQSQHIVNTLGPAGYQTTLIGVQHVSPDPVAIGYDQVIDTADRKVAAVAPAAVEFLSQASTEQPFFLTVGFSETHRVFREHGPDDDPRFCMPPAPLPDTPGTRMDMADYKATVRELDRGIGMVLEALSNNGLAENTLVICTTDHGLAFPGMKCNLTDHGMGVMLIMRGPGGFAGGQVCDALVSQIDIFPTICELTGIEPPEWLQGRSMMPLIAGTAEEIRSETFAEVSYHAAYEPKRCVRTKRWKYIRRFGEHDTVPMANCDDSYSKDVWLAHGWATRSVAREQLYDLVYDPNEAHNLAMDPAISDVLQDLRGRLDRWMAETNDPLLDGPVPFPSTGIISPQDDLSPRDLWRKRKRPQGYG